MGSMPAGILILACWVSLTVYWNISARSIKSAAEQQEGSLLVRGFPHEYPAYKARVKATLIPHVF